MGLALSSYELAEIKIDSVEILFFREN